jgi:preprotein translocase subunit SecG
MIQFLLILQFVLAIIVTISVLLQKSSSIGLGAYSGSNETMFGAKGPANFLTRFTFVVGFLFVVNTVTLGYIYNKEYNGSIIDKVKVDAIVPNTPKVAPMTSEVEINKTQENTK